MSNSLPGFTIEETVVYNRQEIQEGYGIQDDRTAYKTGTTE